MYSKKFKMEIVSCTCILRIHNLFCMNAQSEMFTYIYEILSQMLTIHVIVLRLETDTILIILLVSLIVKIEYANETLSYILKNELWKTYPEIEFDFYLSK